MLLAIDVGNSHTVVGVFHGPDLVQHWRIETLRGNTSDELAIRFSTLFNLNRLGISDISGVAIASVVPVMQSALINFSSRYLGLEPFVLSSNVDTGMAVLLDNPAEIGADRIANAVAAFHRFQTALIVVDFGTAITFDCVSAAGAYLGGSIAPGLMISLEALGRRTSRLPQVDIASAPAQAIGRNTVDAIKSGVLYGYAGLTDGLVRRLGQSMAPEKPRVIATGGQAALIAPHSETIELIEPHLILEGLRLLYERNK